MPSTPISDPAAPAASGDPWYSSLPDDLKGDPTVTRYESSEAAVRAMVAATKRLGVPADQLLRVPTDPNDQASYQTIYKALGAPESADGYQIDLGQGATDADKAAAAAFAQHMFEAGPFPPSAVAAAAAFWSKSVADQNAADVSAANQATADAEAFLRKEWGGAYDQRKTEIGRLIADVGGAELVKELDATALGDSPQLSAFLAKVIDKMAEPGPTVTGDPAIPRAQTPGQAKSARAALEGDPVKAKALLDNTHPQHAAVVAERNKLLEAEFSGA